MGSSNIISIGQGANIVEGLIDFQELFVLFLLRALTFDSIYRYDLDTKILFAQQSSL